MTTFSIKLANRWPQIQHTWTKCHKS